MSQFNMGSLPDPGDRYILQDIIGVGICAKVPFPKVHSFLSTKF